MDFIQKGWYVVYTKPKHEKKVFEDLRLRDCTAYLPLINHLSQWSDRRKWIEKPLFSSYVFVYLSNLACYHRVLSVDGFVMFISFGGKMAMVKDSEIETIKQLIANCREIELVQSDLTIGERRKVSFGPLRGYECMVVWHKGKDRIVVRIESLRQNIMADMPVDCFVEEGIF